MRTSAFCWTWNCTPPWQTLSYFTRILEPQIFDVEKTTIFLHKRKKALSALPEMGEYIYLADHHILGERDTTEKIQLLWNSFIHRYICIKKWKVWVRSLGEYTVLQNQVLFCKCEQLIWNSFCKPGLYDKMFSLCSPEVAFCVNFFLGIKFVAIYVLFHW